MRLLKIFFVFILFLVSACSQEVEYIPDNENLKTAEIGVPYLFKIDILGGRVIGQSSSVIIIPSDAGISFKYCQLPSSQVTKDTRDTNDYNCVEIYGTPTKPGVIKIKIGGGMYGSMITSASEFSKEYTLKVVQP